MSLSHFPVPALALCPLKCPLHPTAIKSLFSKSHLSPDLCRWEDTSLWEGVAIRALWAGVDLLALSSLIGGPPPPCLPLGPISAQAMAPSPCLSYPQVWLSPVALQLCQAVDLTDPDPETQADGTDQSRSNFITVDRLAVTGLHLTLVSVTGPDPALRAVSSPWPCLATFSADGPRPALLALLSAPGSPALPAPLTVPLVPPRGWTTTC